MKRISAIVAGVAALVAVALGFGPGSDDAEAQGRPSFSLPPGAQEVAPGIFRLGEAVVNGRVATGFAIAHPEPRVGKAKPPWAGGGGGGNGGGGGDPAADCFSFIGKGAHWKVTESWLFNAANASGLDENTLLTTLGDGSLEQWDAEVASDVFGGGSLTSDVLSADSAAPDEVNEVYFASIDTPGTIAFTLVWGFFNGPPSGRELIEWDMVFDDVDYAWSLDGAAGTMDFLNIAAHEAGHAAGMGHTETTDTCAEQTMYPTAPLGETIKRDLGVGDQAGVQDLYN